MFRMTFHDRLDLDRLPADAELTRALRVLGADVPDIDYTPMHARLQVAFAERQWSRARLRQGRQWLRVAAVVGLTCSGAVAWWFGATRFTPRLLESRSLTGTSMALAAPWAPRKASERGNATPGDAVERAFPLLGDFVPLPGAAALPELEHADVVRITVPVAGLAAYGFDMVPDAMPVAVAADLLIGQDGVPRAIRLTGESVR
jgi:hypothetical protein